MSDEIRVDGIFDAKLVRENKSAKGIFLTLEIAADDYFAAKLSDVRPGALLKIGYQEIVDVSVQPIDVGPGAGDGSIPSSGGSAPNGKGHEGSTPSPTNKPKRRFEDYPLSAQCAMRCEDDKFSEFLFDLHGFQLGMCAADTVRRHCDVKSRAEFDTDKAAANRWLALEEAYQRHLTDQRHAESIRR